MAWGRAIITMFKSKYNCKIINSLFEPIGAYKEDSRFLVLFDKSGIFSAINIVRMIRKRGKVEVV